MPKAPKKEKVSKRGKNDDTKTKKKRKAKKDPDAPKNPMSAYLLFCEEWREKVKTANPDSTFGELGRILGEKWRGYSDEEKAPYIAKHEKAKIKYAADKAAYDAKKNQDDEEEEEEESD